MPSAIAFLAFHHCRPKWSATPPAARAWSPSPCCTSCRASSLVWHMGFSRYTSLPWSIASRAIRRVPVVRRRHDHRVHSGCAEHLAIVQVTVAPCTARRPRACAFRRRRTRPQSCTRCHAPARCLVNWPATYVPRPPYADDAHVDPVVGADNTARGRFRSGFPESRSGGVQRQPGSARSLKKIPAKRIVFSHATLLFLGSDRYRPLSREIARCTQNRSKKNSSR